MRTLLGYIPLLMLAGLLWACGGDRAMQQTIDRAEALMEEHPDSAFALLQHYDSIKTGSEEQRARFALLYSIALHKNYIDRDNDSLINIAYTYYSGKDAGADDMLATYHKGYVNLNARRFDKAIVLALESLEKAKNLEDTLFMARSYELIGLIEYESYLMEESLSHHRKAAEFYKAAGKNRNHLGALSTAALALDWLGRTKESIQLLDSLRQQAWAINDTTFAIELGTKLIPVLLKNDNPKPKLTDKEVASLAGYDYVYSHNPYALSSLALHRLYKGDLQGCDSLLRCARAAISIEADKASILSVEAERARHSGDYRNAYELTDSMLRLQSSVVTSLFKRDITTAERDYMAAQSKRAEAEKRRSRIALWLSLAGFLILGITAAVIVRIIIRRRNEKIERQIDEIHLLNDNLKRSEARNSGLTGMLHLPHYKALDSICDQYFQGAESEVDQNMLNKRIDNVMEMLRGEESMAAIREFVNCNFDSILDRAKKAIPKIKESDLTFIALIKVGFTARAVCLLQGMKQPTFYSKRDRLEKKLRDCGISF